MTCRGCGPWTSTCSAERARSAAALRAGASRRPTLTRRRRLDGRGEVGRVIPAGFFEAGWLGVFRPAGFFEACWLGPLSHPVVRRGDAGVLDPGLARTVRNRGRCRAHRGRRQGRFRCAVGAGRWRGTADSRARGRRRGGTTDGGPRHGPGRRRRWTAAQGNARWWWRRWDRASADGGVRVGARVSRGGRRCLSIGCLPHL
jgi:hypothetical protein